MCQSVVRLPSPRLYVSRLPFRPDRVTSVVVVVVVIVHINVCAVRACVGASVVWCACGASRSYCLHRFQCFFHTLVIIFLSVAVIGISARKVPDAFESFSRFSSFLFFFLCFRFARIERVRKPPSRRREKPIHTPGTTKRILFIINTSPEWSTIAV